MKIKLLQRLKDGIWEIIAMFVGWLLIFLFNIPITFLTVFTVTLLGYIIGDVLALIVWQRKNDWRSR